MLNFKNWLNESMNVYVDGHGINDFPKKLLDVTYFLIKRLARSKIDIGYGNLEPDHDSDVFSKSGILNYDNPNPKGVSAIKYFLDEAGIKYGPFEEKEGYIQIPILDIPDKKTDEPPEMNITNASADIVFGDILNYPNRGGSYSDISARDILIKIGHMPDYQIDIHTQEPYEKKGFAGATHFHGGYDKERLTRYLTTLIKIAQWAVDHGYDKLYVA